ncbi:MAG: YqhA family protein [Acidimicrobiales bacterium]
MIDDSADTVSAGETGASHNDARFSRIVNALEWGLLISRTIVLLPVVVLVLAAVGSFVYGAAVFIDTFIGVLRHPFPIGNRVGLLMLVIDLFLVGATMLIAAIGFYELFISKVEPGQGGHGMPAWLEMRDLNDLKARVISMIILVIAVAFVDVVVDFTDGQRVFFLGAGVALVIGALTAYLRWGSKDHFGSDGS